MSPKIPGPRKPGQTGGGGRHGQAGNRSRSQDRGGRPHAGGGGSGRKPPGKGCAVVAVSLPGVGAGLVSAFGYGVWQVVS
jgi:hypothetical protein